jgi:hypothetical protein
MHAQAIVLALHQRVAAQRPQGAITLDLVLQRFAQAVRQLARGGLEDRDRDVVGGQEGAEPEQVGGRRLLLL